MRSLNRLGLVGIETVDACCVESPFKRRMEEFREGTIVTVPFLENPKASDTPGDSSGSPPGLHDLFNRHPLPLSRENSKSEYRNPKQIQIFEICITLAL